MVFSHTNRLGERRNIMARKLLVLMALITLGLVVQAVPGSAEVYNLSNLGDSTVYTWTEGRDGLYVGAAGSSFTAYSNTSPLGQDWNIALLNNDASMTVYEPDGIWVTVSTVYNVLDPNRPAGTPLFFAQNYGGPDIASYDAVVTITAKYLMDLDTGYPRYNGQYTIYSEAGQYPTMTMTGSGTNNGTTPFTFIATLTELGTDHTHFGYINDFTLTTYSAGAEAPIPGAVWLLGSGLLGLGCLGRRRRKIS
jgi:hypothetical protein